MCRLYVHWSLPPSLICFCSLKCPQYLTQDQSFKTMEEICHVWEHLNTSVYININNLSFYTERGYRIYTDVSRGRRKEQEWPERKQVYKWPGWRPGGCEGHITSLTSYGLQKISGGCSEEWEAQNPAGWPDLSMSHWLIQMLWALTSSGQREHGSHASWLSGCGVVASYTVNRAVRARCNLDWSPAWCYLVA